VEAVGKERLAVLNNRILALDLHVLFRLPFTLLSANKLKRSGMF
jgi:hypothetical protein